MLAQALTAAFYLLLPGVLAAWAALAEPSSRLALLFRLLTLGALTAALSLGGGWAVVGVYTRAALIGAALLAGGIAAWRFWPERPWWSRPEMAGWAAAPTGLLLTTASALFIYAQLTGSTPATPTHDLPTFPLRGGTFYVFSGGSTPMLNPHMKVLGQSKYEDYRGQAYAVDLVALHDWGGRADGLYPEDPAAYAIFGADVLAPCAGEVLRAEGGLPDLRPPSTDREHLEGNHVLLRCGEVHVLLAHLRQGSLAVAPGEAVDAGDKVGEAGNSGNTSEPHLHIHVQTPGTNDAPFSGDPLGLTFGGRAYAQGDVVTPEIAP